MSLPYWHTQTDLYRHLEILEHVETIENFQHNLQSDRLVKDMGDEVKAEEFVVVGSLQRLVLHRTQVINAQLHHA